MASEINEKQIAEDETWNDDEKTCQNCVRINALQPSKNELSQMKVAQDQ